MPVSEGKNSPVPCVLCKGKAFKTFLVCEGFSFVRCKKCGLVQMNPQPEKEEIIARYSKTYGNDYLSYEIANEEAFLKLQQLALKDAKFDDIIKDDKPFSVLDVGCATGALIASLREKGMSVSGVEISPCAQYARNERRLDVRSTPLEECGFPGNSFDVILASHLIEHLNNPEIFLEEARRICKENGYIFITTPNISGFQARLFGAAWRSAIFDHLYLFSKRTLKNLLKRKGFKIEICRTWGGLAAGTAPKWLKKCADFFAKLFNCGDVMIIRARRLNSEMPSEV